MKRLFLVKGEERHEVELDGGHYIFKDGGIIPILVASYLGYTLEEVETRREWVFCWDKTGEAPLAFLPKQARNIYANEVHVIEIQPNELVLSREDVSAALDRLQDTCLSCVGNALFNKLCRELGFKESEC